jgi:hypothetical protein
MSTSFKCPSSQADLPGSVVFGVVNRESGVARVAWLTQTVPVERIERLIPGSIPISAVVRVASPCVEHACRHFSGSKCSLASRVVQELPVVAGKLPHCSIRLTCRWWSQEGPSACYRCPQVVTEPLVASDEMKALASPKPSWNDQAC